MTRPVRLDLEQEHLRLAAGETARVQLTLRNTSDLVQHLHVEVRGLPAGAQAHSEPATVKLLPAATAECSLVLALPPSPGADAGAYVLGVLARSPHRREVSRCEELRLDVGPEPGLALSVEPELVRSGTRAAFTASLGNIGNTTLRVVLSGNDPERQVTLRILPAEVVLGPRQTAKVAVSARAPRAWTGQDHRRPLTLLAVADDLTATTTVTYVQPPRLPPFALRLLVGVATVLVMASAAAYAGVLPGTGGADAGPDDGSGAAPSAEADGAPVESGTVTPTPTGTSTASPAPTSTPSTAGPNPTATATATTTATTTATATATPSQPSAGLLPGSVKVELVPAGAVSSVQPIGGDTWVEQHIRITPATELAREECRTADRLVAHPGVERGFVTAATAEDPNVCNDVPLRVTFLDEATPAAGVVLEPAQSGDYQLRGVRTTGQQVAVRNEVDGGLLAKALSGEVLSSIVLAVDPEAETVPTAVGLSRVTLAPAPTADGG